MAYDIFRSDMLVFACAEGDEQMVKWCLDNGANPDASMDYDHYIIRHIEEGKTCIELCKNDSELSWLLISYGAKFTSDDIFINFLRDKKYAEKIVNHLIHTNDIQNITDLVIDMCNISDYETDDSDRSFLLEISMDLLIHYVKNLLPYVDLTCERFFQHIIDNEILEILIDNGFNISNKEGIKDILRFWGVENLLAVLKYTPVENWMINYSNKFYEKYGEMYIDMLEILSKYCTNDQLDLFPQFIKDKVSSGIIERIDQLMIKSALKTH